MFQIWPPIASLPHRYRSPRSHIAQNDQLPLRVPAPASLAPFPLPCSTATSSLLPPPSSSTTASPLCPRVKEGLPAIIFLQDYVLVLRTHSCFDTLLGVNAVAVRKPPPWCRATSPLWFISPIPKSSLSLTFFYSPVDGLYRCDSAWHGGGVLWLDLLFF
jgi:hypothetical protein